MSVSQNAGDEHSHCDLHEFFPFTPGGSYPLPQVYIASAKRIVQDPARFQGIHSLVLSQDRGIRGDIYNLGKGRGKIGATDNFNELAFDDQRASLNNRRIDKSCRFVKHIGQEKKIEPLWEQPKEADAWDGSCFDEPFPEKRTRNYRKKQNESLKFCGKLVHAAQDGRRFASNWAGDSQPSAECGRTVL